MTAVGFKYELRKFLQCLKLGGWMDRTVIRQKPTGGKFTQLPGSCNYVFM